MNDRGRFLSGLGSIVVALAGFVTVGALPAAATNSDTVQYVALGDSYAAGQGAGQLPQQLPAKHQGLSRVTSADVVFDPVSA